MPWFKRASSRIPPSVCLSVRPSILPHVLDSFIIVNDLFFSLRLVKHRLGTKPVDFQLRVKVVEGRQLSGSATVAPTARIVICGQTKKTKVVNRQNRRRLMKRFSSILPWNRTCFLMKISYSRWESFRSCVRVCLFIFVLYICVL